MRSQNIKRDLGLLGDELLEKFILQDVKASKYVNSFFSEENILNHSKNKKNLFPADQRKILIEVKINTIMIYNHFKENVVNLINNQKIYREKIFLSN